MATLVLADASKRADRVEMSDRAEAKERADFGETIMQYVYWPCLEMWDIFDNRLYDGHEALTSDGGKERIQIQISHSSRETHEV